MKAVVALITLVLLLPWILGQTSNTKTDKREKWVVTGLYKTEIASPSTFYSTVAPLVYEFKIPKWNTSDFNIMRGANCSSPEWSESSTCPVRFYLPEVISRFADYLFDSQPLVNTLDFMNASPQMSDIAVECDILAKHFRDLYVDSPVLERYLAKLKKCSPIGDMEFYRKVSNYKYNISEVYLHMRDGFYYNVWLKVHDGRIDAGLWSNALNTVHSLLFTNYYIEANRWKFALSDCQSSRIPTSVLAPSLLSDSLQDLFANLDEISSIDKNRSKLVPVISPVDVGNYYKAEIADCTFTNETFIVRILVPVIPSHQSFSLIQLNSVKFWTTDNHICQIELPTGRNPFIVLFDNMEKVAYETDCQPNELCHVPSVKSQGKINPCASAFLNGHYYNVVKYCKFSYEEISPYHLGSSPGGALSVQQVQSDQFVLTGSSLKNSSVVTIRCPGWPDKSLSVMKIGATVITLPCICRIYTSESAIISLNGIAPSSPCDESRNATPKYLDIVPLHWMNDLKLKELRAMQGRGGGAELNLKFKETDLKFPDTSIDNVKHAKLNSDADNSGSISTGTVLVLVLYFFLIILMFLLILFLTLRLKSMGVMVNPLKAFGETAQGVSYTNIGKKYDNGLLSGEDGDGQLGNI